MHKYSERGRKPKVHGGGVMVLELGKSLFSEGLFKDSPEDSSIMKRTNEGIKSFNSEFQETTITDDIDVEAVYTTKATISNVKVSEGQRVILLGNWRWLENSGASTATVTFNARYLRGSTAIGSECTARVKDEEEQYVAYIRVDKPKEGTYNYVIQMKASIANNDVKDGIFYLLVI